MSRHPIRVLLVTEQSQEHSAIPGLLSRLDSREFMLAGITGQKPALDRLADGECDACIIDLPLAEAVFLLTKARQLRIPFLTLLIIVNDAGEDLKAIRIGAPGCLVRADLTVQSLERELLLLTNRIEAVEALQAPLQKSEERYRRIVDEATEIIYRISPAGYFTFVNPTAAAIVQRSVEECLNLHFLSLIRKDYAQEASKFYLEQMRQKNPVSYLEFPAVLPDGSEVWIGQNVQLVIENGKVVELQALGRDITARKGIEQQLLDSEQRYRLLFEANPHPMWVYDFETLSFLTANNAAIQSYGYSLEDFLSMTILDIRTPDERQRHNDHLSKRDSGALPETWKHLKKDGSIIEVEINAFPVIFDGKKAELITATDVTARLRAQCDLEASAIENVRLLEVERDKEEQLRQSQKMEAVGQLAGGIAHDFNNLLTAITGYSEMTLRRLEPESPVRRNVEEIKKAGLRAADLTRQLLAFSREQALQAKVLDINSVVSEMDKLLRRLIGEDIELFTILTPDLGRVMADPGQVEQVLMNLVVNARDAVAEGGKITIETANVYLDDDYAGKHASVESGAYVLLAVSDTGSGMDAATQERIFEPFFTTKGVDKGTGLGLSTVYGVVKQSGGSIGVYSEVGKGTSLKVYLPRVDAKTEVGLPEGATLAVSPGTETVLLVEDEQVVRHMARHILEASGYTVLEAASGPEAMEVCKVHDGPVDLLLTDVVMPHMSGPRLSEEVMKIWPGISVLYMSGYTDNAIVQHGVLKEGMHFLQKPFSPDALALKVRESLDSPDKDNLFPALRFSEDSSAEPQLVNS
jgi:two-component system, cell cycle sensor histidine kinase and response regulator CckA